jgi:glycosyltransferase involved in cell wall biosynthesis
MCNYPSISIVIPARNASLYIKEAIESVRKQNYDNLDIIVVDDGSTDDSGHIASELGCKVITIQPQGAIKARNIGLKNAKGDFILFHDADDLLVENALKILSNEFVNDPQLQVALAMRKDFVSPDLTDEERQTIVLKQEAYLGAIAGCALIKREVFDITGNFDESLQMAGDAMAWQMKLQETNIKTKEINEVTVLRRLHANNMGRLNKQAEHKDYAAILRKRFMNSC